MYRIKYSHFRFDTHTGTWETINPINYSSYLGTSGPGVFQDKFISLTRPDNKQIDVFDLEKNHWSLFPDMNRSKCRNTMLIEMNAKLYNLGGGVDDRVECFDLQTNRWTQVCYILRDSNNSSRITEFLFINFRFGLSWRTN